MFKKFTKKIKFLNKIISKIFLNLRILIKILGRTVKNNEHNLISRQHKFNIILSKLNYKSFLTHGI